MPDYGGIELDRPVTHDLAVPAWAGPAERPYRRPRRRRLVAAWSRRRAWRAATRTCSPTATAGRTTTGASSRSARRWRRSSTATQPDVVHLNDWHTGATLAALDGSIPSVLSLHNLAYQGFTDGAWLRHLGPRARHYEWYGGTNPLSGAIALADAVVAVSPTYAREILTPEGGFGLDGPLRNRWDAVSGILNGIDTTVWDPATDTALVRNYSAADEGGGAAGGPARPTATPCAMRGRLRRRRRSARGDGRPADRPEGRRPARADRADPALDPAAPRRARLRRGGDRRATVDRGGHPPRLVLVRPRLRRASSPTCCSAAPTCYLMPSRFEPCGLTQMQAMRYGTIPVVTDVGGLHDTVADADDEPDGTGFVAPEADVGGVHVGAVPRRRATSRRHDSVTPSSTRGMKPRLVVERPGPPVPRRCTRRLAARRPG